MIIMLSLLLLIIIYIMYRRYFPVLGVKCRTTTPNEHSIEVVDVRDYNQSYKSPIEGSVNIPIAYLPRYFHEISNKEIHVVASNDLDKNMSIRFFRKKGYNVMGYTLTDCKC